MTCKMTIYNRKYHDKDKVIRQSYQTYHDRTKTKLYKTELSDRVIRQSMTKTKAKAKTKTKLYKKELCDRVVIHKSYHKQRHMS
jgi:hypothetical protein